MSGYPTLKLIDQDASYKKPNDCDPKIIDKAFKYMARFEYLLRLCTKGSNHAEIGFLDSDAWVFLLIFLILVHCKRRLALSPPGSLSIYSLSTSSFKFE